MTRKRLLTTFGCCAALAAAVTVSRAGDPPALPQAVRDAVLRAHPGATIGKTERERITITVYEVAIEQGGQRLELVVAQDGTIVEVERAVERGALPAPVAATLDRAVGQGALRELNRIERTARLGFTPLSAPRVTFEAEWRQGNRKQEVGIAADGALEDDDDDDGEDEDDDDDDDDD